MTGACRAQPRDRPYMSLICPNISLIPANVLICPLYVLISPRDRPCVPYVGRTVYVYVFSFCMYICICICICFFFCLACTGGFGGTKAHLRIGYKKKIVYNYFLHGVYRWIWWHKSAFLYRVKFFLRTIFFCMAWTGGFGCTKANLSPHSHSL